MRTVPHYAVLEELFHTGASEGAKSVPMDWYGYARVALAIRLKTRGQAHPFPFAALPRLSPDQPPCASIVGSDSPTVLGH